MLPPIMAGGYGAWFLYDGYKRNPVLRVVGELVRQDGMAQQALGYGAEVVGVEGNFFSWMPGGSTNSYEPRLSSCVITSVSKRPIWLVEAACAVTACPPTMKRIAGSHPSLSASLTSSYPAKRPNTD